VRDFRTPWTPRQSANNAISIDTGTGINYIVSMKREIIITICFLLGTGCMLSRKNNASTADFLPREIEVPGWELAETMAIPRPELFTGEIMNRNRGLIRAGAWARFRAYSGQDRLVTVDLLQCVSVLEAYGLYSQERDSAGETRPLGPEAWSCERGIFARRGQWYIRIETSSPADVQTKDLAVFLDVVRQKLKGHYSRDPLPEDVHLFDDVVNALPAVFYMQGHPDLPQVRPCYVRKMKLQEGDKHIFYSRHKTISDATSLFNTILSGRVGGFILVGGDNETAAVKKRDDGQFIIVSLHKQWIFGILDADDIHRGNTVINDLRKKLSPTTPVR
jgi:hypothetical protein